MAIQQEFQNFEKAKIFNNLSNTILDTETETAINELKCGKAPGPDGITAEIIKACSPILLPYFLDFSMRF